MYIIIMATKEKVFLSIDKDIVKAITKISETKSEIMKKPLIEFSDWDNKSATYNYILKIGLIKFSELKKNG